MRKPAPQQYLKEVTRPLVRQPVPSPDPRPVQMPTSTPILYQPQPQQVAIQYESNTQNQHSEQRKQSLPLYRFVYQHDPQ